MRAQPATPPDRGLRRSQRLTRPAHFREAFDQKKSAVGRFMVLWVRQGDDAARRLGVVASRKVGNAVGRSRAKRRLREAWRLNRHRLTSTADVVLVARGAIKRATSIAIEKELVYLMDRVGLRRPDHKQRP